MKRSTRNGVSLLLFAAGLAALGFAALKPRSDYHPVTRSMTLAAETMSGQRASTLEAEGTDGRTHSPAAEARDRPLVLIFIQDGCPCSEAADPYFRRLHAAYGREASFLGVIDGEIGTVRAWAGRHATPFPILADPDRRLIAACGAERSAYSMVVAPGGRIEALWPGYSSAMLDELGSLLAGSPGGRRSRSTRRARPGNWSPAVPSEPWIGTSAAGTSEWASKSRFSSLMTNSRPVALGATWQQTVQLGDAHDVLGQSSRPVILDPAKVPDRCVVVAAFQRL